ncbi:hypothetical protein N7470_001293 [Penicillium chermesinum]|nr:hypothetical protein N7470_001293 [Penicillium chermesinum]
MSSKTEPAEPPNPGKDISPTVHNAVRLCLSAKEYRVLQDFATKRVPALQGKLPSSLREDPAAFSRNRHNIAAFRASLRVFVGSSGVLKLAEIISNRVQGVTTKKKDRTPLLRSPNFRLSISLSLLLLLHRLLYRFLVRLRSNLRTDDARPFRERNPRVSRALTSRYAPAVGASLAGFALGIAPQEQLRLTATIYTATRSLEFLFNTLDSKGWLDQRPWWFGSWLLMPVSCAQLFHAFIFDRETTPKWFGNFILRLSPSYIPGRPDALPEYVNWPEKEEIVSSLASIANLRWPASASLDIQTLLRPAPSKSPKLQHRIRAPHPSLGPTTCSLLSFHHPSPEHSENQGHYQAAPIGSAWGSVCLFNNSLPRSTLPTKRFFLSGALGGLPFLFMGQSRSFFMYFFRAAVDSAWKTGVKHGLWKGGRGRGLALFVASWALIGTILEANPNAVQGGGLRKGLTWLRGDGFVDPIELEQRRVRRAPKKAENA